MNNDEYRYPFAFGFLSFAVKHTLRDLEAARDRAGRCRYCRKKDHDRSCTVRQLRLDFERAKQISSGDLIWSDSDKDFVPAAQSAGAPT